jgi:PhnB protein
MKWNPHLAFNGQCEAAFLFYEKCFGGRILTMLTWANSPMAEQAPAGFGRKILHATLTVGDNTLAGSDSLPDQYEKPKGFHMLLSLDDPVEAERIYNALAKNGTPVMPLRKTFWAACFGAVTDPFGISWEINCEQQHS